jgi:aspartyl protease family protein
MRGQTPGRRLGRFMQVLAWGAGLLLATRYFGHWQDRQRNPNPQPASEHAADYVEVRLVGNGRGHFVASGVIDGQAVEFLLDTGASAVAIPAAVAERLGLKRGEPVSLLTAGGHSEGFRTRLASLSLGDIQLHDVPALIAPDYPGDQVLLGMSALRQLEFTQRDGTLLLRYHTRS